MLKASTALAGGALIGGLGGLLPERLTAGARSAGSFGQRRQAAAPAASAPTDALTERRAQMGQIPLEMQQLRENIYLLSGPGGNMLVMTGVEGTILVDTGVAPAGAAVKKMVDSLGGGMSPKYVINTHWHFDHTDNNALFHAAGATLVAHENTPRRMSMAHDFGPPLQMHIPAFPAQALPTQTFPDRYRLEFDHEEIDLGHFPPAHTDTDIFVHYRVRDVLHVGDVWFNGMYPFFDVSTGGNINGMIAGATRAMGVIGGDETIIVPGHGPVGDKGALAGYRDMLTTVAERIRDMKSGGMSLQDVTAAKPTSDYDADWGNGLLMPDDFVMLVYTTL